MRHDGRRQCREILLRGAEPVWQVRRVPAFVRVHRAILVRGRGQATFGDVACQCTPAHGRRARQWRAAAPDHAARACGA
ncbi:hypothetical protein RAA17_14205 [Komagataeibacter rhaeticus]|nr:hypothetical protein [Komagataeibacter rhaeticus]